MWLPRLRMNRNDLGSFLVGNFNPEEKEVVDKIKSLSIELIDTINSIEGENEIKNAAIINVLQAQMLAVKLLYL